MVDINNRTRTKINEKEIKEVVEKFLTYHKKTGKEVSIAFVGDKIIKKLNKEYRSKDRVTDILSFTGEDEELGEIIIDLAQIKRQSRKFSDTFKDELIFILVHGLFHLIGYDDKTEKEKNKMVQLGEDFIRKNIKK